MTPEQLRLVVVDMFPYRYPKSARLGRRGTFDARKPAKDAFKKFGAILGVTADTVHAWIGGERPLPKWLPVAIQGMAIGRVSGTSAGVSMYDTAAAIPATLKAVAIHHQGRIVSIQIDNPFPANGKNPFDSLDTPIGETADGMFTGTGGSFDKL